MPQNLLAAAWWQFTQAIFGENAEWKPVYCAECGKFGFYSAGDWAKAKDGRFYHKEDPNCYNRYDCQKRYRDGRRKNHSSRKKASE
jgi:hypothetical protein